MTTEAGAEKQEQPGEISRHWQMQLALAKQEQRDFVSDGRKVVERYKSERSEAKRGASARRFNILFSNTEVMRAAMFGRMAKPDVRRRFVDPNKVARNAAEIIERSLYYFQDVYPSEQHISDAVFDYVLPGRGIVRIEYEPVISERPAMDPMTGAPAIGDDGAPATEEFIADQKLCEKHVFWEDFLHEPSRSWHQVGWIAFRHTFDDDELDDEIFQGAPETSEIFGDAKSVPKNWQPQSTQGKNNTPDEFKKAEVWEVWDKVDRRRIWIVEGHDKPLRIDDDPYGLSDFYPMPEPIVAYRATDSYTPMPEFHAYRDQADDLDEITARISRLTRALKRRGVYDKAMVELKRLATAGDNEFIPVANYATLMQKGGLQQAFQQEDIQITAAVISELHKQRDSLVQTVYEVTGISDIIRGATNPNETLGAQKLKAQFGSNRLRRRQDDVAKWIKGLYRIKAELIAEHFEPSVLQQITGVEVTPEIMQILRDEKIRGYNIDIETDSTIFEDAENEKKSRVEFMTAVSTFLANTAPLATQSPTLAPMLVAMLNFGVRGFKAGRELEDVIEQTGQQLEQQASQPPPPPPEQAKMHHEMQMAEQKQQAENAKSAADAQANEAKIARDMEVKRAVAEQELALKREVAFAEIAANKEIKLAQVKSTHQLGQHKLLADSGMKATLPGGEPDGDAVDIPEQGPLDQLASALADQSNAIMELSKTVVQANEASIRANQELRAAMMAPKRAIRGPDGRVSGVETVMN